MIECIGCAKIPPKIICAFVCSTLRSFVFGAQSRTGSPPFQRHSFCSILLLVSFSRIFLSAYVPHGRYFFFQLQWFELFCFKFSISRAAAFVRNAVSWIHGKNGGSIEEGAFLWIYVMVAFVITRRNFLAIWCIRMNANVQCSVFGRYAAGQTLKKNENKSRLRENKHIRRLWSVTEHNSKQVTIAAS